MNTDIIIKILDESNVYIVILDEEMNIRFINNSLSLRLGFPNKQEIIGKCWLEFIPEDIHAHIKTVHSSILLRGSEECNEYTNKILNAGGESFEVKWYNAYINHDNHWTLSFGMPVEEYQNITADQIRETFKNRIASDRTMIKSLKEYVNGIPEKIKETKTCDLPPENENTF